MSKRVTDKDLEAIVKRINLITGSPLEPYTKGDDGKYKANIGCYHLSHAYGGVSLHRMHNDGGGVVDVFRCGHVSKRELQMMMFAFIEGMDAK